MPWDAVGEGVRYGVLPGAEATPSGTAAPRTDSQATAAPRTNQPSTAPPAQRPGTAAPAAPAGVPDRQQAANPVTPVRPSAEPGCRPPKGKAGVTVSDWAVKQLAAERAWDSARGRGQLVAIVDSGVDGTSARLTGHVTVGVDVVAGGGRGDVDCLGSGTAMAGIVVAQPFKGSVLVGLAPDATVLPIRVVTDRPPARSADQVTAVETAVAAGATVIALGSHVDTNDVGVARAVTTAVANDIVVVAAAALDGEPVDPAAVLPDEGVLRVGAIGVNGQVAARYRSGGVHVVAPGVDVTSLGRSEADPFVGSGTQYAVAYVAGEVALVRSAYPKLSASEVVERVKATAHKPAASAASVDYGYGVIDPAAAVNTVLPDERLTVGDGDEPGGTAESTGGGRIALLAMMALVMAAALVLLVLRLRTVLRGHAEPVADPYPALTGSTGSWPVMSDQSRSG
nr:S8 family serine peptidase [Micromonospora sp. HNM0581]